jgi:hypothetical protein
MSNLDIQCSLFEVHKGILNIEQGMMNVEVVFVRPCHKHKTLPFEQGLLLQDGSVLTGRR